MSELEQAITLLRDLEWAGDVHGEAACPCCYIASGKEYSRLGRPEGIHENDCRLAILIGAPRFSKQYVLAEKVRGSLYALWRAWRWGVLCPTYDSPPPPRYTKGLLAFITTNVRPV